MRRLLKTTYSKLKTKGARVFTPPIFAYEERETKNNSTSYQAGRVTVYLSGELDHHAARGALRTVEELLDEYLPRDCALDLSELSFMDSSGVALIVQLSRRVSTLGGRIWIENPARQPRRVIDASGVDRMVPVAVSKL